MTFVLLAAVFLVFILLYARQRKGDGISIIIPFRCPDKNNRRTHNFNWLKKYWKYQLPGAEVIVGHDHRIDLPFSKSTAVNNAAAKATGDVFVIVDADGYVSIEAILECAKQIRRARSRGHRLWYVPYRQFYRLTEEASNRVLESSSRRPYQFSTPPPLDAILDTSGSQHGHWFGALIQIMPKEAFEEVGGWDNRFRGWGGEDHAAMRAMDTLYWHHKTLPGQVLHLWHPMLSPKGTDSWVHWKYRIWEKQTKTGNNDVLLSKYHGANGHRKRMRKLLDEGLKDDQ